MQNATGVDVPFEENLSAQYAAVRNELYKNGKKVEIFVNFNPKLHFLPNGGNSYTARVKARKAKVFSLRRLTLLLICIQWVSISRKANVLYSKQ